MKVDKIIGSWFADLYDQVETQTGDIEFLLSTIGYKPLKILEACCGSGRILVPLARAGHNVTGFDMDEYMLSKIAAKANDLPNIRYYKADAISSDWGNEFDLVVLAGNLLINIESDMEYKQAQRLFIIKAAKCLKIGGRIYLDFDLSSKPEKVFGQKRECIYFEGNDNSGVYGKYIGLGGTFDPFVQIYKGSNRTELVTTDGEKIMVEGVSIKHIPTLGDVHGWLYDAGFDVIAEYGDKDCNPISENTCRATIYAEKTVRRAS